MAQTVYRYIGFHYLSIFIKRTVSRFYAAVRQLRQIRRAVPTSTLQMLVVALVHS